MAKKKAASLGTMDTIMLSTGLRLTTGQTIDYAIVDRMHRGIIAEFKMIDPNDMNCPWAKVVDVVTNEPDWISLNRWEIMYRAGSFGILPIAKPTSALSTEHMMGVLSEDVDISDFI